MIEPAFVLRVETADGVFLRPIMPASVLPAAIDQGGAAEEATRSAAARWGLPDFVFRPALRVRGSGTREIGDAILVVGAYGASVQVKARTKLSGDERRERSWLDKEIPKGSRQAVGTIRALRSARNVTLTNERGRTVEIETATKTWLKVVVLDHPGVSGYVPRAGPVCLLRRDWEFLFGQLKSTHAVLEYLARVASDSPIPLGDEPVRYYEFAAADAAAPQGEGDPRLTALGSPVRSVPLVPQAPAGHGEERSHAVVRAVLEDIARSETTDEPGRLEALAAIDSIPVAYRAELGRDILSWMTEVASSPEPTQMWRFRNIPWPGRPYLLFGAATRFSPAVQSTFSDYVSLRHQQQLELMPERAGMLSVGVLLTPRHDGYRPWDTTMAATRGEQGLNPKYRAALELLWGPLGTTRWEVDWDKLDDAIDAANDDQVSPTDSES